MSISFFFLIKRTKNQGFTDFLTPNCSKKPKFHKLASLKHYEILNGFLEQFG